MKLGLRYVGGSAKRRGESVIRLNVSATRKVGTATRGANYETPW